jgi:hypothetical protein
VSGGSQGEAEYGFILSRRNYTGEPAKVGDVTDNYPLAEPVELAVPLELWKGAAPLPDQPPQDRPDESVYDQLFDQMERKELRAVHWERCECRKRTLATVYMTSYGLFVLVPPVRRPREKRVGEDGIEGKPSWGPAAPEPGKARVAAVTTCSGCHRPWLILFNDKVMVKVKLQRGAFSARVVS